VAFIADNWQIIFGGVGAAAIAAIIGALARWFFDRRTKAHASQCLQQQIMSGDGATNIMAGRDAKVGRERR
jgi:hypothetical protein